MRRLQCALLAAVAAIGFASIASAADMPVKAPPPVLVPAFSWTGCYVGGHVGGLWARKDWTDASGILGVDGRPRGSHDANGWLGGAQVGCNYQVDRWVFGVQGDYAWSDAEGSHTDLINAAFTDSSRIRSLGSVTGRIGYAWGRFLPYLKGGWAWERDNYNSAGTIIAGFISRSGRETRGGWTIGIGGEYAFLDNWTAFVENNYYDFGTRSVQFFDDFTGVPTASILAIKERKNVLKIGVNFKFGAGTVAAR